MSPAAVANVASAEHYTWGVGCDGWRLLDRPDLAVIQERMPPGTAEIRHHHRRARQVFYLLAGRLEIELDGRAHVLEPGDALEVPPATAHRVRNPHAADAAFLVISAPTTAGDRVNLD